MTHSILYLVWSALLRCFLLSAFCPAKPALRAKAALALDWVITNSAHRRSQTSHEVQVDT